MRLYLLKCKCGLLRVFYNSQEAEETLRRHKKRCGAESIVQEIDEVEALQILTSPQLRQLLREAYKLSFKLMP